MPATGFKLGGEPPVDFRLGAGEENLGQRPARLRATTAPNARAVMPAKRRLTSSGVIS